LKFLNSFKLLKYGSSKLIGRSHGKISVRHRGLITKRKKRIIDIYKSLWNIPGLILFFDYNPKHKVSLILLSYFIGVVCYSLAVGKLKVGRVLFFSKYVRLRSGNCTFLKFIPRNIKISSIELKPNCGSKLLRSPGTWGVIKKKKIFFLCAFKIRYY